MDENAAFTSFWAHVDELRRTFLRILLIIISAVILCFIFHEPLLSFLIKPLTNSQNENYIKNEERLEYIRVHNTDQFVKKFSVPDNSLLSMDLSDKIQAVDDQRQTYLIKPQGSLVYARSIGIEKTKELVMLSPLEGILTSIKISLWIGAFASSPLWLCVLSQFFIPGLHQHERRLILPFVITSLVFIIIGCLFAFYFTIPISNQYLSAFNGGIGVNFWSLANYLDYTLFLLIANGIAFELGAIGIFAVQLQLISAEALVANRRYAILGIFIFATVLTPPDVLTQLMLAVPLMGLFEALIWYAKFSKTWVKSLGK